MVAVRRRLIAVALVSGICTLVSPALSADASGGAMGTQALSTAAAPAVSVAADPYLGRQGTTTLVADMLHHLDQLTPTGSYDPTASLSIGVSLRRPDPAGEDAYLRDVYNPRSPHFRSFLDLATFQRRFGVPHARYQAALDWLHAHGLAVTAVSGSTEYVLATGPASSIESMLGVTIRRFAFRSRAFYANTEPPSVPADLGVLGIAGLESWSRMRTMQQRQRGLPAAPQRVSMPASVSTGATTPQDLWGVYDQPANNTGQGESMAIFGWGSTETNGVDVIGDLRAFEMSYHLRQIPVTIDHFGPASEAITDTASTGEWDLDLPASSGMAPGADRLHLYFGKSGADPDILAAYAAWNSDINGPRQGSSSFAGCEASPATGSLPGGPGNPPTGPGSTAIGNPNQDAYEAQLKEVVALGRTMFVSTGDLGADGCPYSFATSVNGVTPVPTALNNYPSDSQYTTAVGGTVLYWNTSTATTPSTRFLEYSWTHTGGGTSLYISAPQFQLQNLPAPGLLFPCATDWHNPPNAYPPGTLCRGIPDVAAQSGDLTNSYVAGGGTSLSSPLWLGMWTRIQAASNKPHRLGFASEAIYANNADSTRWSRDFFDIGGTSGQTIASCAIAPSPYSCSHPGWDYLSGWGTPDVTNLMKDLDNGNTQPVAPGSTVIPTPTPVPTTTPTATPGQPVASGPGSMSPGTTPNTAAGAPVGGAVGALALLSTCVLAVGGRRRRVLEGGARCRAAIGPL